jgi:glucose/mannose-6-phosphate isomerase
MPPRAALAYLFIPLVCLLGSLGLCSGVEYGLREAVPLLERLRARAGPGVATSGNRAKRLATHLFGRIPWVQGTAGIMSAVAYRWRCQFNENSKALACSSEYPELNHNEVVGWEPVERPGRGMEVIVLRSPGDHWRNRARVNITRRKLIGRRAGVHVIDARGKSPLAQLLWMTYLGDFTSLYLAFLNGVDPAATKFIGILKRDLARLQRPRGPR